jgi:TonB family protein
MRPRTAAALALVALAACAHLDERGEHVEAPPWPSWNRLPGGAPVAYPEQAWQHGLEGDVVVEVCLARDGSTHSVRASTGPAELAEAAVRAISTWRFEPAAADGRPRAACFDRRFAFRAAPPADLFFRTDGETVVTRGYEPPRPAYTPPLPHIAGSGTLYVRICPDETGQTRDVTVLAGVSPDVDVQVERALLSWRYQPARLRGTPIPACRVERFRLAP